ncbi:hypothetical protein QVD17_40326 [Tagetes erecta]|uniref:Uncharacterized protein n=1 Tax=Tagetes erecta TaxID=13708 RepID=A0AAD8NHS6_TARER|nr:hypothetical protein QVD17_40326 [Tagetes erecta]
MNAQRFQLRHTYTYFHLIRTQFFLYIYLSVAIILPIYNSITLQYYSIYPTHLSIHRSRHGTLIFIIAVHIICLYTFISPNQFYSNS